MDMHRHTAASETVGLAMPTHDPTHLLAPTEDTADLSPKGRRTRQRLLEASKVIFERDGFLDARVADIASEAGVSHGTFYTYFDSKTEIFRSLMAEVMDKVWHTRTATDGEPGLSAYERIERSNRQFIRVYRDNAGTMGLLEHAVSYDEAARQIRLLIRDRSVERVRISIERMQAEGEVRRDLDALCTASALVSMVSNFAYFWLVLGEGEHDDESVIHTLTELWASALELRRTSDSPPPPSTES